MSEQLKLERGDRITVWNVNSVGQEYTFDSMFGTNDAIVVRGGTDRRGDLEIIRDWSRITLLEDI